MGHRSAPPARVAAAAIVAAAALGAPVSAQEGAAPGACVLTLEEMASISGLRFASTHGTPTACTYASDPSVDLYALDLRLLDSIDLTLVEMTYGRGGTSTEVGGFPAWASQDGLFVDVGDRVLAVQPVLFMSAGTPDPVAIQQAVAEAAVPRIGPVLEALSGAGSPAGLEARFPAEVGGMPVFPWVVPGDEFLQYVDLGTAAITAVLAEQGLALADLLVGSASLADATEIIALQVPGGDASILVAPVLERFAGPGDAPELQEHGGRLVQVAEALGQHVWLHVSTDVLWILTGTDEASLEVALGALP